MARKIQLEIAGDARSVVRAFKKAGKSADTFHGRIRNVGRGLAKGFAAMGVAAAGLAVAIGVTTVKAAASFEESLHRIVGLAGQSQKQVAKWSDQLLALGPSLGKSPQELADALYFIASSGIPASKAISVLTASAKASAAGLGETEVVADAVTSVMNAYGIANMSAARATSVLVATVREGKGEADSFAGVIGNVTAFASRLGVKFEEVGAALAAMTQLGTDPRTAATQLQAFFSSLLKATPKAEKAFKSVGLSTDLLRETLTNKGLLDTLALIKERFKGNTKELARAFPNIRALRALLGLTADDGGKVAAIFERMSGSAGALGTAFGAAQKTATFNMAQFSASIDALKIAFGQGLLPVVSHVAQALAAKFADPKFVARVRELGNLIGTKLYQAFQAVSGWFDAHWGDIQKGFLATGRIISGIAKAVQVLGGVLQPVFSLWGKYIRYSVILPLQIVLTIISGILTAMSKIPFVGGKFKGAVEAVNAIREGISATVSDSKKVGATGKRRRGVRGAGKVREAPGAVRPRQMGGPVWPGVAYRIGERGPETVTFGAPGMVTPNGGISIGVVNLYGVQNPKQMLDELQRIGRRRTAQRRGRHGGHNLALT